MALIKNIALMGTSTAMRLGCGLLSFVVMARLLGPDQFGILMLCFSAAGLLALLSNYGFAPYLLREIGANPDAAVSLMSEVLTAKIMLSLVVGIIGVGSILLVSPTTYLIFLLLLAAQIADSLTELFNIGYRATNRYGAETQLASIAAVIQLCLVVAACVWLAAPIAAAIAFLIARLIVLGITWRSQLNYYSQLKIASWRLGWVQIKRTHTFASDFALQNLFGQVDSIVLNHFLGPASVGIYQAGMRVFNGGAQVAGVLANVFLPRAAQSTGDKVKFAKEMLTIQSVFVGSGLIFGLLLAIAAKPITILLFGENFLSLAAILPWFGALFLIRFIASSWGIILTSLGEQSYRAKINLLQWVVALSLSVFLVPQFREIGWLISLIMGNFILIVAYCVKSVRRTSVSWVQIILPVAACLFFIPVLQYYSAK
jgi:O-antigen/teichoic acid export membrane protein